MEGLYCWEGRKKEGGSYCVYRANISPPFDHWGSVDCIGCVVCTR